MYNLIDIHFHKIPLMINIRGIFAEKNHVGFALHNLLGKSILITFLTAM